MRIIYFTLFFLLFSGLNAQFRCVPSGDSGSGYPALSSAGFGIEDPDCVHSAFGPHVTQAYDELLDRNVFVFHSHIEEDNDRCQVFDRVRMEVKGGPNTDNELQHPLNSTSYYRWKFKLADDFVGTSSFCHLFQNKVRGGGDDGFPVITFTARAEILQLRHNGGDSGTDLGTLAQANLDLFRGKWVEAYMRQRHSENGSLEVYVRDMSSGDTILAYQNDQIDLWRPGVEYSRPKFGIYRRKATVLKDEIVLFADFCVSETSAALCPPDTQLIIDDLPPTPPSGLTASDVMIDELSLRWLASTDNVGVSRHHLFQDGTEIWSGNALETTITGLTGSTTYAFYLEAEDGSGNRSTPSDTLEVMTDEADALPDPPGSPVPVDGQTETNPASTILSWRGGENTDSFYVYLDTVALPRLVSRQLNSSFTTELSENTTYYWRVGAVNENGESLGPTWSFSTGADNQDAPWLIYRGNARPESEVDFFELNTAPENPDLDEVVPDSIVSGNNFFRFFYAGDENFRWRYRFTEVDSSITVTARFKAISDEINGICYFEIRGSGWREKIRINQSTIKFERSSPVVEEDLPFDPSRDFHLIRITMKGPETTVYFDEDPLPFARAISGDEDTNEFFEWGKSGGQPYGAEIDWIGIILNQDYPPGEGPAIPTDLILSNDATLFSLAVDGNEIEGFRPDSFSYDFPVSGPDIPQLMVTPTAQWSTTSIAYPNSVPNTAATVTVTAQDGISQRVTTVNFVEPSILEEPIWARRMRLYPNPVIDELQLSLPGGVVGTGTVELIDQHGRSRWVRPLQSGMRLDVSGLHPGMVSLRFRTTEGFSFSRRVLVVR